MFVLLHRQRPLRQPVRKPSVEVSVLCSAQHQVEKYEAGALDEDAQAADLLQEYEAKIAAPCRNY